MTVTSVLSSPASPGDVRTDSCAWSDRGEAAAVRPAAPAARPVTAVVVGASGYTGALLAELFLRHPGVKLEQLSSEQLAGASVADHLPRLRTALSFAAPAEIGGVDVAFVCAS